MVKRIRGLDPSLRLTESESDPSVNKKLNPDPILLWQTEKKKKRVRIKYLFLLIKIVQKTGSGNKEYFRPDPDPLICRPDPNMQ